MTKRNTESKAATSTRSTTRRSKPSTNKSKPGEKAAQPSPTAKASGTDTDLPSVESVMQSNSIPLNERATNAYWFPDSRFSIADHVRMAAVFDVIADEIETWAPSKAEAKICHLQIMEVAARLRELGRV